MSGHNTTEQATPQPTAKMRLRLRRALSGKVQILLFLFSVTLINAAHADTYLVQLPRDNSAIAQSYYHDLLAELVNDKNEIETIERPVTQGRSLQLLDSGELTVAWSGTSIVREKEFRPIRVPMYLGLLGVRVPVIRKNDVARFRSITDEQTLQDMVACQGDQWPDSDILEHNQYRVERVALYESMFKMLQAGRCDYFPRSIIEVHGELSDPGRSDLMAYEGLLLSYPFPMYYFMSYQQEAKASDLERKLYEYATSGKLLTFMKTHPTSRETFPLTRFKDSTIFYLHNPDLPTDTPISDTALWLMPGQATNEELQAQQLFMSPKVISVP